MCSFFEAAFSHLVLFDVKVDIINVKLMLPFNQEALILILIIELLDLIPLALVYLQQEHSFVFVSLVSQNEEFSKQVDAGFYVFYSENLIYFHVLLRGQAYD